MKSSHASNTAENCPSSLTSTPHGCDGSVQVVWFKRDLRLADHAPLTEAAHRGAVLPVYLIEPEVIYAPDFDARHWAFLRDALGDLARQLTARECPLRLLFGEATACLDHLTRRFPVAALWSHQETGNAITFARDRRVARWSAAAGLPWTELPCNGVVRGLRQRDGWHRQWEARMQPQPLPVPAMLGAAIERPASTPPVSRAALAEVLRAGVRESMECLDLGFLQSLNQISTPTELGLSALGVPGYSLDDLRESQSGASWEHHFSPLTEATTSGGLAAWGRPPPLPGCSPTAQRGGEALGQALLGSFLAERGARYTREMSSPISAEAACTRLSPHLAYGCLSIRQVVHAAREALRQLQAHGQSFGGKPFQITSLRSLLSRLHWHCHFIQKLEREPEIEHHCFHRGFEGLREGDWNADRYRCWLLGQTGYPFIDACLRMLRATGWINFRMRAMLTSFAAYDLWLDWRGFKDGLARLFTDYEPGIHFSQCQMQSGVTGINTLRIYNPIKQGYDQDPEGHFIRRWVPELAHLDTVAVHQPWKLAASERALLPYPPPVIDHAQAIRKARQSFSQRRQSAGFRTEAQRVYQTHGSRKNRENRHLTPSKSTRQAEDQLSLPL